MPTASFDDIQAAAPPTGGTASFDDIVAAPKSYPVTDQGRADFHARGLPAPDELNRPEFSPQIQGEEKRPPVTPVTVFTQRPGTQTYTGPGGETVSTAPKQQTWGDVLQTPLLPADQINKELGDFLVGPFDWFHRSAIKAALGMSSPVNLGVLVATGGLGTAAAAENAAVRTAAKTMQGGVSAYFASEAGKAMTARRPELLDAWKSGDYDRLFKVGGEDLVDAVFGGAALAYAGTTARELPGSAGAARQQMGARFGAAKSTRAEVVPDVKTLSDDDLIREYQKATGRGDETRRAEVANEVAQREMVRRTGTGLPNAGEAQAAPPSPAGTASFDDLAEVPNAPSDTRNLPQGPPVVGPAELAGGGPAAPIPEGHQPGVLPGPGTFPSADAAREPAGQRDPVETPRLERISDYVSRPGPISPERVPLDLVVAEAKRQEQFQLTRDEQTEEEAMQHARDNTLSIAKKGAEQGGFLLADIPTAWLSPDYTHVDDPRQKRLKEIGGTNDPIFVTESPHIESGSYVVSPINGNNRTQWAIDHDLPTVRGFIAEKTYQELQQAAQQGQAGLSTEARKTGLKNPPVPVPKSVEPVEAVAPGAQPAVSLPAPTLPSAAAQPVPQVSGPVSQVAPSAAQPPAEPSPVPSEPKPESQIVQAQEKEPHDYSSTQLNLSGSLAKSVRTFGSKIPDQSLTEDGRESEPHITVKYGLHGEDPEEVRKLLEGQAPIIVTLGKASIFPASESGKADVLKVDVKSPELHALNKKISDALPHTDTFPGYQPHVTIAYLKPGEGAKYAGKVVPGVTGEKIQLKELTFSDKSGNKTVIPLGLPRKLAPTNLGATVTPQVPPVAGGPTPKTEAKAPPGPIPAGTFMNEAEIDQAVERYKNNPVLSRATKFLSDLRDETNAHSDGWPYWKLPIHAASQLMGMIQHPEYATEENFKKALAPIRAFYTKRGTAAGMKFPEIAGVEVKPAEPISTAPAAQPQPQTVQPQKALTPEEKIAANQKRMEEIQKQLEEAKKPKPAPEPTPLASPGETPTIEPEAEGARPDQTAGPAGVAEVQPEAVSRPGEGGEPPKDAGREVRAVPGSVREPSERPQAPAEPSRGDRTAGDRAAERRGRDSADYRITPDDHIGEGGLKQKAQDNLEAIRVLQRVEAEGRPATPEEQKALVKYVGWGGMPQPFAEWGIPRDWQGVAEDLKSLLSEDEFNSARASTPNAHYTSPMVIQGIWDALRRLGAVEGLTYLEPAMGVGHFYGLMPDELMPEARRTGIELDTITGRIAKLLYPKTDVHVAGFQDVRLPDNFFDIAVSNVPFGNYGVHDPAFKRTPAVTKSIHDYFFAKGLDKVRPGGIVAFITSNYTMDKLDPYVRKYLASKADLVGVIRLPNTAFKGNAGTEVTTDILFLQKRAPQTESKGESWASTQEIETTRKRPDGTEGPATVRVNEYYARHPEMMVGKMTLEGTMYRSDSPALVGELTPDALQQAIGRLPQNVLTSHLAPTEAVDTIYSFPEAGTVKDGAYAVKDGLVVVRHGNVFKPAELTTGQAARVKDMLGVRDALRDVFRTQMEDAGDKEIEAARRKLNQEYDAFVKKQGYLSSRENARAFHEDPDAPVLLSLENWDPDTKKATKTAVFTERTIPGHKPVESVGSAKEALAVSLNEKGRIDWTRMQDLTGRTPSEMQKELGPLVFRNPSGKQWETAEDYLSGNVRQKLDEARAAASADPLYERNVQALQAVQPKDLLPEDIDARLGASWIPKSDVQQFIADLLGVPAYSKDDLVRVGHAEALAQWSVQLGDRYKNSVANSKTYGTNRFYAHELIEDALNLKNPTAYDRIDENTVKINEPETLAAREMMQQIKDRFKEWAWQDPDRSFRLADSYNREFNGLRLREYDGSHLNFPGMTAGIQLRPHQKNAIWRIVSSGKNTLLAHVVGAGKTYEMVSGAMELRRLGLSKKPMFVVPKNRVEPTGAEYLALYPGANILVMAPEDFTAQNRQKIMGRIATGNYDSVIVSYESFEKLPVSDETFNSYLQDQIDHLEEYIREMKGDKSDTKMVKELEKSKKRLEAKLRGKADRESKDEALTFEQLGVDSLFVDEADNFKNLFFPTKMTRIAGIPNTESKRAFDMYIKTQHISKMNGGRGIVFATGTPVANSMAELWTMQRYLQPEYLREHGMQHFDAWAQTFGEVVPTLEVSPDASGYRMVNRFAKFVNIPELVSGFRQVADVQTADMLKLPVPRAKRETIAAPASDEQKAYIQALAKRAKDIRDRIVKDPRIDNMLKISTDGRKAGLDMRLVDPGAPDFPDSKVNKAADRVYQIWKESKANRSAQLVFLDFSKPREPGEKQKFSVYDDFKAKLIKKGIPEKEIAFIHDATSTEEAAQLSRDVNSGKIRILMGSTQKMGVGLNVQKRLIAEHHLDAPWRPRDIEQREGRILRQGNENPDVMIKQYVTEPSFDAKMWDTLKNKAFFIGQVMRGDVSVRTAEDISDSALTYAEVAAIASGNPAIREKTIVDAEVRKLDSLRARHEKQQADIRRDLQNLPSLIETQRRMAAAYAKDIATREANPEEVTVGTRVFGKDARKKAAEAIEEVLYNTKSDPTPVTFGKYRGLDLITVPRRPVPTLKGGVEQPLPDVSIHGALDYRANTNADDPLGTLSSIEYTARNIERRRDHAVQEITDAEKKLADTKELAGKSFPQEQKLKELLAKQKELEKQLKTNEADAQAAMVQNPEDEKPAPGNSGPLAALGRPARKSGVSNFRYKPVYRNHILFADEGTTDLLGDVLGSRYASGLGGMMIPYDIAVQLPEIIQRAKQHESKPVRAAWNYITKPLQEAIREAVKEGHGIVVVRYQKGDPLSAVKATARHETFHLAQQILGRKADSPILDHPLAQRALQGLASLGYDTSRRGDMWAEIGAHLAEGPDGWNRIGLSRDEAKQLFRDYLKDWDEPEVLDLKRISPALNEVLHAARSEAARVRPPERGTPTEAQAGGTRRDLRPGIRPDLSAGGLPLAQLRPLDATRSAGRSFAREDLIPSANEAQLARPKLRQTPVFGRGFFESADARYEALIPNQPGHVYLNLAAQGLIQSALAAEQVGDFDGLTLGRDRVRLLLERLGAMLNNAPGPIKPRIEIIADAIRQAVNDAHSRKGIVTLVESDPQTPTRTVRETRKEEEFHRQQLDRNNGDALQNHADLTALAQHPKTAEALQAIRQTRPHLNDQETALELGATVGTGRGADVGLTPDESGEVFARYYEHVAGRHGAAMEGLLKYADTKIRQAYAKRLAEGRGGEPSRPRNPEAPQHEEGRGIQEGDGGSEQLERPSARGIGRSFASEDLTPAVKALTRTASGAYDDFLKLLAPGLRGPKGKYGVGLIREREAEMAQRRDRAVAALKGFQEYFESQPVGRRFDVIDSIETGNVADLSTEEQDFVRTMRSLFGQRETEIEDLGLLKHFLENYFPHLWKDPDAAETWVKNWQTKRPLTGGEAYRKKRTIPTIREGMNDPDFHLEPAFDNPVDFVLAKLGEEDKSITAHKVFHEMKDRGELVFVRPGMKPPEGHAAINDKLFTVLGPRFGAVKLPEGQGMAEEPVMWNYQEGTHEPLDPNDVRVLGKREMGKYYAPEPLAHVINNHLSPGLRNSDLLKAWGLVNRTLNMIDLGASWFHGMTTNLNSSISDIALGLLQLETGKPVAALKSMGRGLTPFASLVKDFFDGTKIQKVWDGKEAGDLTTQAVVDALKAGGGRARQDQYWTTNFTEGLQKAWRQGNIAGAGLRLPFAALEQTIKPIMEYLVPRAKLAAFARRAQMELERAPNMTREEARDVFGKLWDSIDNRFGQLNQRNLLMHSMARDLMNAVVGRPGWNIGTVREIGGGAWDLAAQSFRTATEGARPELPGGGNRFLTDRMAYVIAMVMATIVINGVANFALTGEAPHGEDFLFPRDGGTEDDGRPSRIVLPFYLAKDVYSYATRPLQTLKGKAQPALTMAGDLITNRDGTGRKIFGEGGIGLGNYLAHSATPYSVQGILQNVEEGKGLAKTVLPALGVMPAPRRAGLTAAEQFMAQYRQEQRPSTLREKTARAEAKSKIIQAIRAGNLDRASSIAEDSFKRGRLTQDDIERALNSAQTTPFLADFKSLPLGVAIETAARMNLQEKQQALPILVDKLQRELPKEPAEEQQQTLHQLVSAGLMDAAALQ